LPTNYLLINYSLLVAGVQGMPASAVSTTKTLSTSLTF